MAVSRTNWLPVILCIAGLSAFFWFGFSTGESNRSSKSTSKETPSHSTTSADGASAEQPIPDSTSSLIEKSISQSELDAVALAAADAVADDDSDDDDERSSKNESDRARTPTDSKTALPPEEQRLDLSGGSSSGDDSNAQTTTGRSLTKTAEGLYDLTFDDVKFDLEPDEPFDARYLTDEIRQIDGQPIRIRGYIKPSFSQRGLKSFVFVRDNKECCFGPSAALYDCMLVKLKKGKTADYTVRPVAVEGTFYLKEYKGPDGNTWAIYRMKDAVVK